MAEVAEKAMKIDGVKYFISVAGYSMLGGGGENVALGIVGLDDWSKRKSKSLSIEALTSKLLETFAGNKDADINFFAPPSIPGIGKSNGLSLELVAKNGSITPNQLFDVMENFLGELNKSPELAYAFSTFTANAPHIYLDVDRTKLESYQIPVVNLFTALQNNLGSRYINNITLSGQVNKVIIQADYQYRKSVEDINNIYVPSATGALIKVESFADVRTSISPKIIYRYNQYTDASVVAQSKADVSTGTAIGSIRNIAQKILPKEYGIAWTGLSLQEVQAAGLATFLIILALVFCYLFLVALYESWMLAFAVMFSTVFAILGALIGLHVMGQSLSLIHI